MVSRHVIWIALLMLGVTIILGRDVSAQTRLGLHVTQEELNIWKQRAKNGPYKKAGDVRPNSPGDWERILANANSFRSNPSQERWNGYTGAGCMTESQSGPGLNGGTKLRDAAFAYLLTTDTTYFNAVRNELLTQTALSGVNFGNTTKFSRASGCLSGTSGQKIQQINAWVQQLTIGYDYIRSSLTSAQRATLDAWFLNAGNFLAGYHIANAIEKFPNRNNDDYSNKINPGNCANGVRYSTVNPFSAASCRYEWQGAWSNLPLSHARTSGTIGVMLNNATLINDAKRFMREWLMFMIYPDGSSGELDRWKSTHPNHGIAYVGSTINHFITFADALARSGDTSLYDFSTSSGAGSPINTSGGPKNILKVITTYLQMRDHTIIRYAASSAGAQTTNAIMDGVSSDTHSIADVWIAQANHYFNSAYIKGHYMRTSSDPDVPDYPANPAGGQGYWGGCQNILPGVLFLFGDMEGKASPYPGKKPVGTDLPAPKTLRLISGN
jgi:hypothetical protein